MLFTDIHINNREIGYFYKTGYHVFGPVLLGFTDWLMKKIKEQDKTDTVYFLAREGKIFEKAFHIYQNEREDISLKKLKTQYVYVSRKSIIKALLWSDKGIENKIKSLSSGHIVDIDYIVRLLGIEKEVSANKKWEFFKGKKYRNINELVEDIEVIKLLKEYEKLIEEKSKLQFYNLKKYLHKLGVDSDFSVLVDIGWKGTMQEQLNKIYKLEGNNKTPKFKGYYLGVKLSYNFEDREGYIFTKGSRIREEEIFSFGGLLESMFSAQEGSVELYSGEDEVVPCLGEYEYNDLDANRIKELQIGALEYVREHCKFITEENKPREHFKNIIKTFNYPTREDIQNFNILKFEDKVYGTCMSKSLMQNKEKRFIKRLYFEIMNSNWKVGYLKNRFGRWFPAAMFYRIIYRMRK